MSDLNNLKELALIWSRSAVACMEVVTFSDLSSTPLEDAQVMFGAANSLGDLINQLEAAEALNSHLDLAVRKAEGVSEALRRKAEAAEAEIARRDQAAGEPVHFYREHNPNNGMKTDWIEVDSIQLGFLQESTDPDTAEFRTLYTTAPPSPSAPDGWKLVPIELTLTMQHAWDSAPNSNGEDEDVNMQNAYRAMIAAAPGGE